MATRGSYNSPVHLGGHAASTIHEASGSGMLTIPPLQWASHGVSFSLQVLHLQQFQSRKELEIMHVLVENFCIIKIDSLPKNENLKDTYRIK